MAYLQCPVKNPMQHLVGISGDRIPRPHGCTLRSLNRLLKDYLIGIIDLGIKEGEFKNVNSRITALSILINIEGIHWFTLFDKSGVHAYEYIDTISGFIINGLKKRK